MEESITGIDGSLFENYIPLQIPMLPPLGSKLSPFQEDKTPKPLTIEEQIVQSIDSSRVQNNYDNPIFHTSLDAIKRYDNPLIEYKPGADMEEVYAQSDPFTWGDSATKFAKTFRNHIGSSFQVAASMISSLSKGESILDNNFSEHMAMLTENLELEIPQYKTAYERENPFALDNFFDSTIKSILPSAGTALGGIADMLIGHAIMTLAAPVTFGASATAGNAALLAKDAMVIKNIFSAGYNIAKSLNTAKNLKNIGTATQMVGTSLFYANSEAALQARMNENSFMEKEKAKYFKATGMMPTGKALEDLEARGASLSKETYAMNLALIAGSSAIQFPSLLNGKFASNIAKDLPITFDAKGIAIKSGAGKNIFNKALTSKTTKDFFKSAGSEGSEEFFQGVIDNSTQDYYSNTKTKDRVKSYMTGIGSKLNQEGLLEFVGGAIIGGGMSLGGSLQKTISGKEAAITNEFITGYNASTARLQQSFIDSQINLEDISQAIQSGNEIKLEGAVAREVFNTAKTSYNNSTLQPRRDYLMDLKNMPIEEFNKYMGNEFTVEQQQAYIDETLRQFNTAASILEGVDAMYQINPLINDSEFEKVFNNLPLVGDNTKNDQKAAIWSEFKDVFAQSIFEQVELESRINDKETNFKTVYGDEVIDMFTTNIPQAVLDYKSRLKNQLVGLKDTPAGNKIARQLEKLDTLSVDKQYQAILEEMGVTDPNALAEVENIIKLKAVNQSFLEKNDKLQTNKGLREEITKLADYFAYRNDTTPTPPKPVEEDTASKVTKEKDEFVVKNKAGDTVLKTKDEVEAKAAAVQINEQEEIQEPVKKTKPVETQENIQLKLDLNKRKEVEESRLKELASIGQKALQRRLKDLKEASTDKDIAQAIIDVEKNVKRGALITEDEQALVDVKRKDLKDRGIEIISLDNKIYNDGLQVSVLNFSSLADGELLSEEQIEAVEKELEKRKKKVNKLKELGKTDEEIEKYQEDDISIMTTVQPQLNKDGKMTQSAKVDALLIPIEGIDKLLIDSKKNPNNKVQNRVDKINAKYDAQIEVLNTPLTKFEERLKLAMTGPRAGSDLIKLMIEKQIAGVKLTPVEEEFVTQFKDQMDQTKELMKSNPEAFQEEVPKKVKRKEGTHKPTKDNLFMVNNYIGDQYRITDDKVFIRGIDITLPDDAQDIEVDTTPVEVTKEEVLRMVEQSDKPYLKQIFKDNFGLEATIIELTNIDKYIQEKSLSLGEENIIRTLKENKLITIEC